MDRASWAFVGIRSFLLQKIPRGLSCSISLYSTSKRGVISHREDARGQVGTVVELLAPEVFEVEFCDEAGRTYMSKALNASQLMLLHYKPQVTAA